MINTFLSKLQLNDTNGDMPFLILSVLASTLICLTYIPGAYKIWKTNDTRGTSLLMYLLCDLACLFWVIAALVIAGNKSIELWIAILISNMFVLVCSSLVLYKKIKFMREAKRAGKTEYDYVSEIVEKTKIKK